MAATHTRYLVLGGAGLVGISTAATSAVSLYQLAARCGIPEPFAAALPIALDAGATVAALVWITERGELRTWGRGIAIGALAGTLAGNAVLHALVAGLMNVTLPLVLAVGAAIPAMLFCVAHLAALMTASPAPAQRGATPKPRPAAASTPRARPVEPPVTPVRPGADAAAVAWARAELAAGRTAGWKRIRGEFPALSERAARKAATEARNPGLRAVSGG